MNYQVFRLLRREELETVVSFVSRQTFVDGSSTAHGLARAVKNNLQIDRTGPEFSTADRILVSALQRNRDFQSFALPKRIMMPLYSRYDPGMEYGSHIDDGIMNSLNGDALRSDIAVTIFLSPPESYDGGELAIHLPLGQEEIKLDAGEAVAYSANSVHHVAPVTRGVRLAAVTWAQSVVRDERVRAILCDLGGAIARSEAAGDPELSLLLSKSYHNLLRYAAEP
jgi:PKHD-type hydroxylase